MKRLYSLAISLLAVAIATAQQTVSLEGADEIVRLWDNTSANHSNHQNRDEQFRKDKKTVMLYTSSCELYIFKANTAKNRGIAVVICPGGAYSSLGFNIPLAKWYASQGVTAALLKYRLPNGHKEAMLEDSAGAVRYLRTRTDLCIDPAKVGISGNSAGGHLAAWTSNIMADEEKPAFAVLHYPAIDRVSPYYIKSKENNTNILGADFTLQQATDISAQNMVSRTTPPTLIMLCDDDTVVPPTSPVAYYEALLRYGVKASIHIFPKGGHSLKKYTPERNTIITDWLEWLGLTNK
jgi:acetyl esterase/lipase